MPLTSVMSFLSNSWQVKTINGATLYRWIVYVIENPKIKWMRTRATHILRETSTKNSVEPH